LGLLAAAAYVGLGFKASENWWGKSQLVPLIALAIAIRVCVPRYTFTTDLTILVAPIFAAIAVNHAENFPSILKKIMSTSILRWFGRCSFSIYLWQQPFFFLCLNYRFNHAWGVLLGVALGSASFYLIENPSRNFLTRKWQLLEQQYYQKGRLAGDPA
jgi:peptidoglycan/LPS O-acetylase OafA/YrhL